jgi:hypothetical protein
MCVMFWDFLYVDKRKQQAEIRVDNFLYRYLILPANE